MAHPSTPIKLYRTKLSGHSHRVEALLSLLGLPTQLVDVDMKGGANRTPEFLRKNPLGQVPVIEDGALTLYDSNAILVYLATRYDAQRRWYPVDPLQAAQVQVWLSAAAGSVAYGINRARLVMLFGRDFDLAHAQAIGLKFLNDLDAHLASRAFLVGDQPTIADVSIYSYTAVAPEGGLPLAKHPHVEAWLRRIEALPGFVPMTRTVKSVA